jgi:hypothetical protein
MSPDTHPDDPDDPGADDHPRTFREALGVAWQFGR